MQNNQEYKEIIQDLIYVAMDGAATIANENIRVTHKDIHLWADFSKEATLHEVRICHIDLSRPHLNIDMSIISKELSERLNIRMNSRDDEILSNLRSIQMILKG